MDIKIPLVKIPLAVIDSIDVGKQLNYQTNGLTVISNNTNIVPRDTAGNVMLREDATDNPLLIIEPTTKKITTKSILRVIDTQFKYFKFPATTTIIDESADLNLDLDLISDPIYARYKPSEDRRINEGVINFIAPYTGSVFSGILMDEIEDGIPQKNTNAYYITKEIKNSGKDLRIRIQIEHRYDTPDANEASRVLFSLIKTNVDTGIDRSYRVYPESRFGISQYQVKTLIIDDVLLNSEFNIGDNFLIGAVCRTNEEFKYHTINAVTSYWVITDNSKRVDEWNQELPPLPPVETEATTNQSEMPQETS
jgi:hypothetical protein